MILGLTLFSAAALAAPNSPEAAADFLMIAAGEHWGECVTTYADALSSAPEDPRTIAAAALEACRTREARVAQKWRQAHPTADIETCQRLIEQARADMEANVISRLFWARYPDEMRAAARKARSVE